ncbi:MAG: amino acid ABC transporter permease [Clostridia bacterium]|nr:amino acid ABC transporter permease [Clostridia bacterium]
MGFFQVFLNVTYQLWIGFQFTLKLFLLTLVFSLPLGLIVSFGSMCRFRPLKWLTKTFVWIIRGTPLMLQLIIIFYGPGLLGANFHLDRFLAALIAFVINYSCYFSEIYRGGIESISKGQYEAGQVLGLTKTQVFFRIVLLQVVKRIVPPMSNEIITLVKDTSLATTIGLQEIIFVANRFQSVEVMLWPLFYTGVFYLAFCGGLTLLFGYIEKKLSYFRS